MNDFINRFVSACRVIWVRRVFQIEVHRDKKGLDRITFWGTNSNKSDQVKILRALADSIQREYKKEDPILWEKRQTQKN